MSVVYLLWHKNVSTDDDKLLGVFSSEEKAKEAIYASSTLSGFKSNPDSYLIDRYEIDHRHWLEGF